MRLPIFANMIMNQIIPKAKDFFLGSELLAFEKRLQSSIQIVLARAELVNFGLLDQGLDLRAYLQTSTPLLASYIL